LHVKVAVLEQALLPCEFCLLPIDDSRVAIFRYSRSRPSTFNVRRRWCFVQQLYLPDTNLTFNLSFLGSETSENIDIPNVAPDIPICFFVVGANPDLEPAVPVIYHLPRGFAFSCCWRCAESIPERNAVVDIDSHEIYTVGLSLESHELLAHNVNRDSLSAFAFLAQQLFDRVHITDVFRLLAVQNDCFFLLDFVRFFFSHLTRPIRHLPNNWALAQRRRPTIVASFLELVHDMEVEWSSSTRRSRLSFFQRQFAVIKSSTHDACARALRMLKNQNTTILVLRTALSEWTNRFDLARFWDVAVRFALHAEAMAVERPQISGLRAEMQATAGLPISRGFRHRLSACGLFQERTQDEDVEVEWWKARIRKIHVESQDEAVTGVFETLWSSRAMSDPAGETAEHEGKELPESSNGLCGGGEQ
jgi:hypothetical protein